VSTENFFTNLPPGKIEGICESVGTSKDGGARISIFDDCINCGLGQCFMFKAILDKNHRITARRFISHPPEC